MWHFKMVEFVKLFHTYECHLGSSFFKMEFTLSFGVCHIIFRLKVKRKITQNEKWKIFIIFQNF
jgi:hypothetical protein